MNSNWNKEEEILALKHEISINKYALFNNLIRSESPIDRTKAVKLLDAGDVNDEVFRAVVTNLKFEKNISTKLATIEFLNSLDDSFDDKINNITKDVFLGNAVLEELINY